MKKKEKKNNNNIHYISKKFIFFYFYNYSNHCYPYYYQSYYNFLFLQEVGTIIFKEFESHILPMPVTSSCVNLNS